MSNFLYVQEGIGKKIADDAEGLNNLLSTMGKFNA